MSTDKAYKSKQVFNYIFAKAQAEGIPLTPMKAIKLVYFAHAWTLGFTGKPLLDEPIQAWRYGAVVTSLYHDLKLYGSGDIKHSIVRNQQDYIIPLLTEVYDTIPPKETINCDNINKNETDIIDSVWNAYKGMTAAGLSNIMHQAGTPWSETYQNGACGSHAVISNELIKRHYQDKINKERADEQAK